MMKTRFLLGATCIAFSSMTYAEVVTGVTKPISDVAVSMSVGGVVDKVLVKEGQQVSPTSPLIQLQKDIETLELKRRKHILDNQSQLDAAQDNLQVMETLLQESEQLLKETGSVSLEEVQKLRMRYREQRGAVESLSHKEQVERLEYQISELELAQKTMRSPLSGLVTELNIEPGEWVKPGEPLVRIVNTARCLVELNIEQYQAHLLSGHTTLPVNILTSDAPLQKMANIEFISPVADSASGLIRVKLELDNTQGTILPGMTVEVNLPDAPLNPAEIEPLAEVASQNNGQSQL